MTNNPFHSSLRALIAGAAFMTATACTAPQGSVNRYSGGEGARSVEKVEGNWILSSNLETTNVETTRRNDLLTVQFDLVNKGSWPQAFQWTVDWYDRQGMQVPNATRHWEPMKLAGYASQTVTIVAPHASATQWQLQVGSRNEVQ